MKLSKHKRKGRLIVFEGTDGAGKTTMIDMTLAYLRSRLGEDRVLSVKQPTELSRKTKLFQKMMYCADHRGVNYRALQLLTLSDRVQHNSEVILPALKEGKWVICDRYVFTSAANMAARGYTREKWFFLAAQEIEKPDTVFFADTPPELAIKRIRSRPDEAERYLDTELLRRVHREFGTLSRKNEFVRLDTALEAEIAFLPVRDRLDQYLEEDR